MELNWNASPTPTTPIDKRLMDVAIALPALIFLAPFFALIGLCIKLEDPGPVFFKQKRYGLGAKIFEVYKFRSMTFAPKAEFSQAVKNDPRVTRIGAFIRRTSIDELPQLINVLLGDMSLVGPRPHPLSLDNDYKQRIPDLMHRYNAIPGITGWAQINGLRGETRTVEDMKARVEHDLHYVDHRSLLLDFRIILKTAVGGWTDPNAY